MNFKKFQNQLSDLIDNKENLSNELIIGKWVKIKEEIVSSTQHSRHVSKILDLLNDIKKKKEEITILDYGCGGCITIFYLIALGYENIWGVDVGAHEKKINNFLNLILDVPIKSKKRIKNYLNLPIDFEDNYFDLIFTQQVFEHISFRLSEKVIIEISRLLKQNGVTYNQIPHKLVPFDYHTKTWFIHWLPKHMSIFILKIIQKNYKFVEQDLWLRFPWEYQKLFTKHIGNTKNFSHERISAFSEEFGEFKGINKKVRMLVSKLCSMNFFGHVFKFCFSYFVMLELVSKKK